MIGIVGHVDRLNMAQQLAGTVGAEYVSVDDGTLGCDGNHRKVWSHLMTQPGAWHTVLEDDAQPVTGFRQSMEAALTVAPAPIVSFYLGTSRPPQWQPNIRQAIKQADKTDASWITTQGFIHGVAVAIRAELIPDMLDHTKGCVRGFDFAIRDWARNTGRTIAFTWPSMCDHHDAPTLIQKHPDGEPRQRPRKAHRYGMRHTWTTTTVEIT